MGRTMILCNHDWRNGEVDGKPGVVCLICGDVQGEHTIFGAQLAVAKARVKTDTETEADFMRAVKKAAQAASWLVYHTLDSRGSDPGFPDLCCVHTKRGNVLWLELKSEKGKLTDWQRDWLKGLRLAGQLAFVARPHDWEDITAMLVGVGDKLAGAVERLDAATREELG